MQNLLPHYERELSQLRLASSVFAQKYPKIAGRLALSADTSEDPHAERMIESFALLAARVHKRLDDDFPLFTESMLEVLYPHYLRPFPACSIAQFDLGSGAGQLTRPAQIDKGETVAARPVKGVTCKFKTTQDVTLLPLKVAQATYRNAIAAPEGTRLPAGVTSVLSIKLSLQSPQAPWASVLQQPLRFYLDGEASQVSVLREALVRRVVDVMVQTHEHRPWQTTETLGLPEPLLPKLVGFDEDQALLNWDARSHVAYRLLTEYFAFPEKFNFVDVPVPRVSALMQDTPMGDKAPATERSITLHLVMAGVRSDSDESRLLEMTEARNFALGCSPVINLFEQPADPIRVTQLATSYPVVVDSRRAFGYEVHGINKVFRVKKTVTGEEIDEFRPFFSLRHDDWLAEDEAANDADPARYWFAKRDDDLAEQSPGYETEISIVDLDYNPAVPQTETLSLTVSATNRDLPSMLPFGVQGGDLFLEGGSVAKEIRLLRKPTATQRFDRGNGALWRLISHLSLNHLSLSSAGVDGLKEMFRLYDLSRSAANRRQIDGLISVDYQPTTAWLQGEPFASFVRGTEVRVTLDEDSFVGSGLGLFVAVLDRFFGLYAHANSFTQLTVVSARTQEVVMSCPPRNGAIQLV